MRREDKRRMPPLLRVHLPPGYHLERVPDGFVLYVSYLAGGGQITRLVRGFPATATAAEIESVSSVGG